VGLWLLVPTIALGLLPAAVLDRGPSGEVRPTLFPFALVALDPFVWDCVRNSLAVATIVSFLSWILGVNLARLVTRRRFWGRPLLVAIAVAPLVVPPVVGALGLRLMFGSWLEPWASHGIGRWLGWLCWVWVGCAVGTPMVGLVAGTALTKLEPGWADAARLAGASRYLAWRGTVWPLIRPAVASAVATVFTLTLLEPGAPLLLGLRRTLAYQTVETFGTDAPFPRAAILGLMAVGLALTARLLLRWWGGAGVPLPSNHQDPPSETVSLELATLSTLAMLSAVFLAWLPALAVFLAALKPGWMGLVRNGTDASRHFAASEAWSMVGNSLIAGLAVVALQLLMVAGLAANRGSTRRLPRFLINWPAAFPPLALGVGALALPWLLSLGGAELLVSGRDAVLARVLRWLESVLAPSGSPGLLLAVAVAVTMQPLLAGALGVGRGGIRPELYDAALSHGASRRRARRLATGLAFANSPGVICLLFSLAATNLAPALILTPTWGSRTIAPGIVALADQPDEGLVVASRLATLVLIANLLALAFALRGWHRSAGQWLRPTS